MTRVLALLLVSTCGCRQPVPAVQPTDGHDAYASGARVKHNGKTWESTVDNNVWEPGVFGWEDV